MKLPSKKWLVIIGFIGVFSTLLIIWHLNTSSELKTNYNSFNVKVLMFNHAMCLFEGERIVELKFDTIKVFNRPHPLVKIGNQEESPVLEYLTYFNSRHTIDSILNLKLSDLKDFYNNENVVMTSGDEYQVIYVFNVTKKAIFLHHYYEPTIQKLIQILNRHLPVNFQLKTMEGLK